MTMIKRFFTATIIFASIAFNSFADGEPKGVLYDLKYDINKLTKKSKLIFVGNLKRIPKQIKTKKINEDEYKIDLSSFHLFKYETQAKLVLKGDVKKSAKTFVLVDTTYNSSMSHLTPTIDNRQYIFLLKRMDPNHEGLEKGVNYYELAKGWHGMIALEKEAKSQRAVRRIKEVYGIDVLKSPESFIKAVKLLADEKKPDEKTDKATKKIYSKIIADTPTVDKFKKKLLRQNRKE